MDGIRVELFVSKNADRIVSGGAASGNVAGEEGDGGEQQCCASNRERIGGLEAVEFGLHEMSESQR